MYSLMVNPKSAALTNQEITKMEHLFLSVVKEKEQKQQYMKMEPLLVNYHALALDAVTSTAAMRLTTSCTELTKQQAKEHMQITVSSSLHGTTTSTFGGLPLHLHEWPRLEQCQANLFIYEDNLISLKLNTFKIEI